MDAIIAGQAPSLRQILSGETWPTKGQDTAGTQVSVWVAIHVWILHTRRLWVGDFTFTLCEKKIPHLKGEPLLNISYTQVGWDSYILLCRVWCGHCVISSDGAMSGETLMMLITRGGGASQSIIGDTETGPQHYRRELTTMPGLKLTGISTTTALISIPILIFRVWNA